MNRKQRRASSPAAGPSQAAPLFAQATGLHQAGRLAEAEQAYRRVLALAPGHAGALKYLGLALVGRRAWAEAATVLATAAALHPEDGEKQVLLGIAQAEGGQRQRAVESYRASLARREHPDTRVNLGNALAALGHPDEAEAEYLRALALNPRSVEALANLGNIMRERGRLPAAAERYGAALALVPAHAGARIGLCLSLSALGRHAEAETVAREGLRLGGEQAGLYNALGVALNEADRPAPALEAFRRALALAPAFAEAHTNAGIALRGLGQPEQAIERHRTALAHNPGYADAHYNMGLALEDLGRLDEAMAAYGRTIALMPDHAQAHWSIGVSHLKQGDFPQGWRGYEWRWRCPFGESWHRPDLPVWRGEDLGGRTLLLWSEQGLGDTIQFCRFAWLLAQRGERVVLEVQPPLVALLAPLGHPHLTVVPRGTGEHGAHCQQALMSLPGLLSLAVDAIPAPIPYLRAEAERVERWRTRLPATGLRVGIAWQGNPKGVVDVGRSIPLRCFAPLARLPDVHLISLQKHQGAEQVAELPSDLRPIDLGPDFDADGGAFLDSAAVMACLDLVISSDTAIAHLAGALGRPLWLALKCQAEWRWLRGRDDSPWYPHARLFRQDSPGDWDGLFARIGAALAAAVAASRGRNSVSLSPENEAARSL